MTLAPDTSRAHEARMALRRAYKLLSLTEAALATADALVMAYGPDGAELIAYRTHEKITKDAER